MAQESKTEKGIIFCQAGSNSSVPPLVFIHAFPLNYHFWDAQIKEISKNYRVIALDLPGFANSNAFQKEEATMRDFGDAVISVLDHLKIDKAIFCGCSMGGYIMLDIWKNHQNRVAGFIFCNTRCEADGEEAKANRYKTIETVKEKGTKPLSEVMVTKYWSERMLKLNEEKAKIAKEWIQSNPVDGIVHACQAMATRPDSTNELEKINVPTMIIAGTEDTLTGEKIMAPMKEKIKNVQYEVVKDAGHLAPFDSPQQVNKAILNFMEKNKW